MPENNVLWNLIMTASIIVCDWYTRTLFYMELLLLYPLIEGITIFQKESEV